jgi:hypothetical protein
MVPTVTLPEGRYYYGHWNGPTVQIYPLEMSGKTLNEAEAMDWMARSGTELPIGWLFASNTPNPFGGRGVAFGTKTIDHTEKTKQILQAPFAPAQPGRYELRLYDRGFDFSLKTYVNLHFSAVKFTVAAPAAAPRFVRQNGERYEAIEEAAQGEDVFVEAACEAAKVGTKSVVTLEWGAEGARQERVFDVLPVDGTPSLCRSRALTIAF